MAVAAAAAVAVWLFSLLCGLANPEQHVPPTFSDGWLSGSWKIKLKINVLHGGGAGADFDGVGEACGATPSPIQKVRFGTFGFKLKLQNSDLFIKPIEF